MGLFWMARTHCHINGNTLSQMRLIAKEEKETTMSKKKKKKGSNEVFVQVPSLNGDDKKTGVVLKPGEAKEVAGLAFRYFLEEKRADHEPGRALKARKMLWGKLVGIAERMRQRQVRIEHTKHA